MLSLGVAPATVTGRAVGFLGGFTAASVGGGLVRTALVSRAPQVALEHGLAVFLLARGWFVHYEDRDALQTVAVTTSSPSAAPATTAAVAR